MSTMIPIAFAQRATALTIINTPTETRAVVLLSNNTTWLHSIVVVFIIMACLVTAVQCFSGSDVLRWRSFYSNENKAWKRHYREVFDHGIREALCCLGRVKYLTVMDEDEVFSVAQLLGDLVSYRASGKGHLELLAGLALLRRESLMPKVQVETVDAPTELIQGAIDFHPFAEAAYTGPFVASSVQDVLNLAGFGPSNLCLYWEAVIWASLYLIWKARNNKVFRDKEMSAADLVFEIQLTSFFWVSHRCNSFEYTWVVQGPLLDVGRNPLFFLCAWLHRQGVLCPLTRKRHPILDGDNWWRGHARAFLKYVNLPAEALRQGRVCQTRCEAAYFVVVFHHIKCVVICVRGTETPEDLLTDGLSRECMLATEDFDGLIHDNLIPPGSTHYGHSGIVEAARDLYEQIDGNPKNKAEFQEGGLLTSLLGAGCECEGYDLRVVGHSLGGAIAAMLGLKLYGRYPRLHVYSYGPLPCVDSVLANACSGFITSIVYDTEFSSRLSVASIIRLQTCAMMALSNDADADSAIMQKVARRFLSVSTFLWTKHQEESPTSASGSSSLPLIRDNKHEDEHLHVRIQEPREDFNLWHDMHMYDSSDDGNNSSYRLSNNFDQSRNSVNSRASFVSQFMEAMPSQKDESSENFKEMFLAGTVIHIVPEKKNVDIPLYKRWATPDAQCGYEAYVANREAFKDMIVSPSMFIDHLPWR
ncbi:Sn1-specific diacylglycerol lipase beta [Tanacetum coccineum]|uniref:Sn1-specific diacylglycerol lipase beta n=1 Tax=Tanacetum coccineum TaxID=301880 RepID=A0ABQ4WPG6_9ASTR